MNDLDFDIRESQEKQTTDAAESSASRAFEEVYASLYKPEKLSSKERKIAVNTDDPLGSAGDVPKGSIEDLTRFRAESKVAKEAEKTSAGTIELGKEGQVVHKNDSGQITRVDHADGTRYDYQYDKSGQLKGAQITAKDGTVGEWKKEADGRWQAYADGKPAHLKLQGGNWQIREDGRMYHSSGRVVPAPERGRRR